MAPRKLTLDEQTQLASGCIRHLEEARVTTPSGHSFTKAAPSLYPHLWSWDSAFIALGLAHLDVARACDELRAAFSGQWRNGKVPHITYNPAAPLGDYFPDAARWDCKARSGGMAAADGPDTSGLIQPPVHALAAMEVWRVARKRQGSTEAHALELLRELLPKLLAWHRYLCTHRDPEASGLVTLFHSWESGTDNSPRWDAALAAVRVDKRELPPYQRADLKHGVDASERPTNDDYERYLWLVELYKRAGYEDKRLYSELLHRGEHYPFVVKDVLLSAILYRANTCLLELTDIVGAQRSDLEDIERWLDRGRAGIESAWDEALGGTVDIDLRTGLRSRVRTIANFAPLIAGTLQKTKLETQLKLLDSEHFCGAPHLARALPPSTSPTEPAFNPKKYWRGPTWAFMNGLIARSLDDSGATQRAEQLRSETLAQIFERGPAEYFNPYTDEPLGSRVQSWTNAFVLTAVAPEALERAQRDPRGRA